VIARDVEAESRTADFLAATRKSPAGEISNLQAQAVQNPAHHPDRKGGKTEEVLARPEGFEPPTL
jgi:hypothetical protein